MRIVDGLYEEVRDDSVTIARALTAGGGPLFPPAEWYQNPGFDRPTPITVTADGRVKGHIATWTTDHIGLPPGTKPPRSRTDYAFFKTGVVTTDDGSDVPVGQITLAGGHAPMTADAAKAVAHYDDTASSVADVTVGEDEHGIWVSGGIRPGVDDEKIRALRASAPSGDWRPIDGALELVAVCQVNTPGFPIARAMVASGELTALVAAGSGTLYELQQEATIFSALERTNSRVAELESIVASLKSSKGSDDDEKKKSGKPSASSDVWAKLTASVEDDDDDDDDDERDAPPVEKKSAPPAKPDRREALRERFKKRAK